MAQRIVKNRKLELFFILIIFLIFFILSDKYIINGLNSRFEMSNFFYKTKEKIFQPFISEKKIICNQNQIKIFVTGGNLCRKKITTTEKKNYPYLEIFDTYPKTNKGKEIIYTFLDEGDITIADSYLNNELKIERYDPVKIKNLTWEEDPYNERYWRFIFYSLRETRHLLYAYKETGDEKYKNKLIETIEDFIDNGIDKPHAWDDYHGVAFRTMTLVNTWWKLREQNALPLETSEKILKTLQRHGEFLLADEHYENKYNHGISQMAALLVLSVNFPELDKDKQWFKTATARLNNGIDTLVNTDGILIENSPYYHFYILEKYFLINKFTKRYNIEVANHLETTVQKMISYASYILQPNLQVPLLGASLKRAVGNTGIFYEIAKENPEFLYVLTQGRHGKEPKELNKHYSTTGQVIMRSGWDKKTKFKNNFGNQTQIIFDVGPYRTDHSDLDALSFNLYSNGKTLLTDTGLFTYEDEHPLKSYFHGTRGHNTVLVDGKNQRAGSTSMGELKQTDEYAVYSAQHNLFPRTNHQRAILLLGHDLVLIVDRLLSKKSHDYEQLFHLFPEAKIQKNGTTLIATGEKEDEKLTIRQLVSEEIELSSVLGDEQTGNGFCSFEYEKKVPCHMLSYKQHSQNASYITLLEIGNNKHYTSSQVNNNEITINTKNKTYKINLNELDTNFLKENKLKEITIDEYNLNLLRKNNSWQLTGNGEHNFKMEDKDGKLAIIPKNKDGSSAFIDRPYYVTEISDVASYYSIEQDTVTDIPIIKNQENFKVYEQEDFLPILGYHHIFTDDEEITHPTLQIHASDFEKQLKYLTSQKGCRWFTFEDIMENYILKNKKTPSMACVISFDDGRKNHFTNGYEILKKYGAIATFYIITERASTENSAYMDFSDLDELTKNGNMIGSHTINASGLITDELTPEEIKYQLTESKKLLEQQGYKITTFAYPRGEQNEEIINLTSKVYLAGRDTEKDNQWREKRPLTTSFAEDFIWHMYYHKPELETPEELWKSIGYNTWWQFEEDYRIDNDSDQDIQILSSYKPTDTSYANVSLRDPEDQISNKFIVSKDATYTIEVYGTVNAEDLPQYSPDPMLNIYIDNEKQALQKNETEECTLHKKQYYCFYNVSTNLKKGTHSLSIKSVQEDTKVDKFRIHRPMKLKNSYDITIKKLKKISPEKYSPQLEMSVNIKNHLSIWTWLLFSSILLLLGYIKFKK